MHHPIMAAAALFFSCFAALRRCRLISFTSSWPAIAFSVLAPFSYVMTRLGPRADRGLRGSMSPLFCKLLNLSVASMGHALICLRLPVSSSLVNTCTLGGSNLCLPRRGGWVAAFSACTTLRRCCLIPFSATSPCRSSWSWSRCSRSRRCFLSCCRSSCSCSCSCRRRSLFLSFLVFFLSCDDLAAAAPASSSSPSSAPLRGISFSSSSAAASTCSCSSSSSGPAPSTSPGGARGSSSLRSIFFISPATS
mmetsp:Transcript_14530/g.31615  ORF Transcript_14530/g.31615 Transcript_14530/m.31615 type:complete len:250 (+) Transcript_14530:340-1089(+)